MNRNIVLLHGWGANITKLQPLAKSLQKIGWQTLVLKLPGFDAPLPKKPWSLENYANFVLEKTHTHFGEEFFLFGHSFGGKTTAKLAIIDNQSLLGIILCASSGFSRANPFKRVIFRILAKVGKVLFIIPPIAKISRKLLYKIVREHDYEKTQGTMRETFKRIIEENLKIVVNKIKIPVLLLWGKQDKMTPVKGAHYIKKVLSKARLVIFNKEGHQLPYNKPKNIAKTINQWSQDLN